MSGPQQASRSMSPPAPKQSTKPTYYGISMQLACLLLYGFQGASYFDEPSLEIHIFASHPQDCRTFAEALRERARSGLRNQLLTNRYAYRAERLPRKRVDSANVTEFVVRQTFRCLRWLAGTCGLSLAML